MNLDELRTVQSTERSKDSLQHLRESFYADVGEYVADLRERRDRAAEQADDPFDDPEVNRLTDEINTAEEVVEAVYERRVGKVVKRASLAAAGMPADEEGLTTEEQELFAELVDRIEANKSEVLDVLAGETDRSAGGETGPPQGSPATDGEEVSADDLVGERESAADPSAADSPAASEGESTPGQSRPPSEAGAVAGASEPTGSDAPATGEREASEQGGSDETAGLDDRTKVLLTDDVGEIFGVDERTYDLASQDVVTLPAANADPLVERGAAEKLE